MCCTTRTNQVHQPSRHQFLREKHFQDWISRGKCNNLYNELTRIFYENYC